MALTTKRAKMTVDLGDPALVKAIRHVAVEQERPVRAIVVEALRKWLQELENQEDLAAIDATAGEPDIPWEQVKAEIREREATGEQGLPVGSKAHGAKRNPGVTAQDTPTGRGGT